MDRCRPDGWVFDGEDLAGDLVVHYFFRSAMIADQYRQSRRLGFDDDLTQRVGLGWEDEEIAGGVKRRELFIILVSQKVNRKPGDSLFHHGLVWAVAGNDQSGVT